jgi:hypothetical protein
MSEITDRLEAAGQRLMGSITEEFEQQATTFVGDREVLDTVTRHFERIQERAMRQAMDAGHHPVGPRSWRSRRRWPRSSTWRSSWAGRMSAARYPACATCSGRANERPTLHLCDGIHRKSFGVGSTRQADRMPAGYTWDGESHPTVA